MHLGKYLYIASATAMVIGGLAVGGYAERIDVHAKPLFEREYVLPHAKAGILELLLKLDQPSQMTIRMERGKMGLSTVIIAAPPESHEVIGPFVKLIDEKRLAYESQREKKAIERTSEEYYNTHIKPLKKARR